MSEDGNKGELKLFVGGLAQETTREQLQTYFETYGRIKEAVVMMDGATRRSRGFGFVTFETSSMPNSVLESEHTIDGRKVDVKRACPKGSSTRANGMPISNSSRSDKIFVGGLPDISTEEFEQYFQKFGDVIDAVLMTEKASGRLRGFGFVTFKNSNSVDEVMKKYSEHNLKGKWIECKRATPKETMKNQMRQPHGTPQGREWNRNAVFGGPPPPEDYRNYVYYDPYVYQYEAMRGHCPVPFDPFAPRMRLPYPGPDPYASPEQSGYVYPPMAQGMNPISPYAPGQIYEKGGHYHGQYATTATMAPQYAARSYQATVNSANETASQSQSHKYGPHRSSNPSSYARAYPY